MNPEIELVIRARNEAKRALNQLEKQMKSLERQMGKTGDSARQFTRHSRNLAPILIEVNRASSIASRGFLSLGTSIVRAASAFESYENTIRVFSDTQEQANQRLMLLLNVTRELVGIETGRLIQAFGRISQLDLPDARNVQAIAAVTKAIAEQAKPVATTNLVLEQWIQALGNVKPLATDFRTLFREIPQLPRAIEIAFGQSARSAQEFRQVLEDVGISWQDARIQLIEALDQITVGANVETLNAQLDILSDTAQITAASFGKILVPAIVDVLKSLTSFLKWLENLDEGTKRLLVRLGVAGAGGATLVAGITGVTLALGAMNAALAVAVGATGFAGLKLALAGLLPFIGTAGLVVAGFVAAGVAIHQLNEISSMGRVEVRKTTQEYENLKNELIATGQAVVTLDKAQRAILFQDLPAIQVSEDEINKLAEAAKAGSGGLVVLEEESQNLPKVAERVRFLTVELVKADTALRRARQAIRAGDAQTVGIIEQQTQAEIDALRTLAELEIEQAMKTLEDEEERAARILEIRHKLVDDIAEAEQRGAKRIEEYEKAVYDARIKAGEAFTQVRTAQVAKLATAEAAALQSDFRFRAFVASFEKDQNKERIRAGARQLAIHAHVSAQRVAREKATTDFEKAENLRRVASAQSSIYAISNEWIQADIAQQNLDEARTEAEAAELLKRQRLYGQYFQYINRLNLQSKEQFIASAIQVTATIIKQVLIQRAVQAAVSGNIPGAIGFGVAALGATGLEGIISNALTQQRGTATTRNIARSTRSSLDSIESSRSVRTRPSTQIMSEDQMVDSNAPVGVGPPQDQGRPLVIQLQNIVGDRVVQTQEHRVQELTVQRRI